MSVIPPDAASEICLSIHWGVSSSPLIVMVMVSQIWIPPNPQPLASTPHPYLPEPGLCSLLHSMSVPRKALATWNMPPSFLFWNLTKCPQAFETGPRVGNGGKKGSFPPLFFFYYSYSAISVLY